MTATAPGWLNGRFRLKRSTSRHQATTTGREQQFVRNRLAAVIYTFASTFNACRIASPTASPSGSFFTAATASLSL